MAEEHYLEYLPPCGGVNFVIGRCDVKWIRVEAYVEWGWDWLIVLLDGEQVIRTDADMGQTVKTPWKLIYPPKSCTNITVGLEDPTVCGLSQIKVWYVCEEVLPEPEFEIVSVRFEQ